MACPMSKSLRREECLRLAAEMVERLEGWYDVRSQASFGEIEQQARQERREFMGQVLGVLINGRDRGICLEVPSCEQCKQDTGGEPGTKAAGGSQLNSYVFELNADSRGKICSTVPLVFPSHRGV